MDAIKVITLSGSPRERGRQHGEELRDGIRRFYAQWMDKTRAEAALRLSESELLDFTNMHAPITRRYAPDLYEELEGLAEGAGISFEQALFINCFDELDSLPIPPLAAQLVGQAPPPGRNPNGCTSFAAFSPATSDGKVYIGQGYDVGTKYYEPVILRIEASGDAPEQLAYGHAGVLGVSGMNDAGLAIVENSLKPSDQRPGVPYPVVVRKALQQTILSEFIRAIITAPRACGQNYVVGSPFGALNIETSAARWSLEYLTDGIFGHANHYEAPDMMDLEMWPPYLPDSLVRSGRMEQLLKAGFGSLDLEAIKEIMRDHANYPYSICRHEDNQGGYYSTLSALIYCPADRLMLATYGTPCESPYQEFTTRATERWIAPVS